MKPEKKKLTKLTRLADIKSQPRTDDKITGVYGRTDGRKGPSGAVVIPSITLVSWENSAEWARWSLSKSPEAFSRFSHCCSLYPHPAIFTVVQRPQLVTRTSARHSTGKWCGPYAAQTAAAQSPVPVRMGVHSLSTSHNIIHSLIKISSAGVYQWGRSVVKYGVRVGRSGQAIKLFQIISYVYDFQTLNNPGSWQPV